MEQIETHSQVVWMDAYGIVHAELKSGALLDRNDAVEAIRAIAALCNGTPRPVLVDMTRIRGMDRGARLYFAGPETARHETAAALLVRSPLTRAIGNFFMGLNKPTMPTRLFSDEAEAIAWLRRN